jgi:tellurite resistance protein TerC
MSLAVWIGFLVFVGFMLAVDLGFFHRKVKEIDLKGAIRWTALCVGVTVLFTGVVYSLYENSLFGLIDHQRTLSGRDAAIQFFTAWLLEQSLSLDNIFVMAMIFRYFEVPAAFQHRVLLWGIIGAVIMRGIFIAVGATLIHAFDWTMYLFGAMLVYAAIKTLTVGDGHVDLEKNPLVKLVRRFIPITDGYREERFFSHEQGRWMATPMFLVLLVIESCDLVFAVDSIPAVFGVTNEPFIVFTSNIFAILCLRSLYFILANLLDKFRFLKVSLFAVLAFIGTKMLIHHFYVIPSDLSLLVVGSVLFMGVVASYLFPLPKVDTAKPGTIG